MEFDSHSSYDELVSFKRIMGDREDRITLASREKTLQKLELARAAAMARIALFTSSHSYSEILGQVHASQTTIDGIDKDIDYYSTWTIIDSRDVRLLDNGQLALRKTNDYSDEDISEILDIASPAITNSQLFHIAEHLDKLLQDSADQEDS